MQHATAEEWRPIPGHEDRYEVSSLGRVRSLWAIGGNYRHRRQAPLVLKTPLNARGYQFVNLRGAKARPYEVHYLVCEAFHGPRPSLDHTAAHRDGKRQNNTEDNIRWATWGEQAADRKLHGTAIVGEAVYGAKLTEDCVRHIRSSDRAESVAVRAARYGVSKISITRARQGRTWAHV